MSSVTLIRPAKAIRRNEMSFGRYTRVVPNNIVLDRGPVSPGEVEILEGPNPSSQRYAYRQITLALVIIIKNVTVSL